MKNLNIFYDCKINILLLTFRDVKSLGFSITSITSFSATIVDAI